ncbi:ABC transporter ATP-binding protein [Microvirga brassicacearum]|uniref:ABC transporter ATP-binding protein n=1 Tax=Microvirga brassicacearum TaxID=2580413 RepID=A0A5N3PHN0_9HYPH|nr:ABC transporter ATP-binding protein [Microvirga brassicacearum]KAB0269226.1 ABC transporter ATP-binding protein [Microvirga brassicacearum]
MQQNQETALDIRGLRTEFKVGGRWYPAVRDLSLDVAENETLAIVGESGSGKSVTALSILRLLPQAGARIGAGEVLFEGRDLTKLSEREMSSVRGNSIAMIFQEPMTSLNPTMTVGEQIAEAITIHRGASQADAMAEALRLLKEVKIPSADSRLHDYPHQFSGGMRQRVMIAMALACRPKVLLADEPTTALDVTIQAQVLMQLDELKEAYGMSVVFITHNLGVVAQIADRVAVMYAGEVVELATVDALFANPAHPYTVALLRTMPRADRATESLEPIPGSVPPVTAMPEGCAYASRCPLKQPSCEDKRPELLPFDGPGHQVRCPVRLEQTRG